MLQLLGFEVEIASNGSVAVDMFMSGNYSLVFMDCQMPVMDGYEAARKIRDFEKKSGSTITPVIALTAGSDEKDRERCLLAGMNDYITKPFNEQILRSRIKNILKNRQLLQDKFRTEVSGRAGQV